MTKPSSRRNFLLGRFSRHKTPLRPPWSLAEDLFLQACTRCGECSKACPTHIITDREAGYPIIDFAEGECTFCGDCVNACNSGALKRGAEALPWLVRAVIGENCLIRQRIDCRICFEQCEADAISFAPKTGAGTMSLPVINAEKCTGCGACVGPCPTRTIALV